MAVQECALWIEIVPKTNLSRVVVWELVPASRPAILDVMEGEFAELIDLIMSRYNVRYFVTPENSLRRADPATIRRLAACLHAYLLEFQDSRDIYAEPPEAPGTVAAGADVATAPIIQQVLNVRCRVIIDNDLRTMGALRAVMDRMAASLIDQLMPVVEGELDSIIHELRAANFEAAFTSQVTVEPADQSQRELARAIGETRQ